MEVDIVDRGTSLSLQAIGNRWRMVASRERRMRFGRECLSYR